MRTMILNILKVRDLLIAARIERQKATVLRDFISFPRPTRFFFVVGKLDKNAAMYRSLAKGKMVEFEKLNGRLLVQGMKTFPLSTWLDGKNFRHWAEYSLAYDECPVFDGVDPE